MEKFEFNNVNSLIYSFIWNDFCDNYIEMAKFTNTEANTKSTLLYTLTCILKMLHPFMPYVTDAIYEELPIKEENIMISSYPVFDKNLIFNDAEQIVDENINFIKNYRNVLKENNIYGNYQVNINFTDDIIIKMLKLKEHLITENLDITSFKVNSKNKEAIIYYEKEITAEDKKILEKRIADLKISIAKRENLLQNENFTKKAPQDLVAKEKAKLIEEKEELEKLIN